MAAPKRPVKNGPVAKKGDKPQSSNWYIIPLVIIVLSFVLYGNSIKHDYALDDDIYTRKNVYVQQGFSHFADIFNKGSLYGFNKVGESQYRPLSLLNFMVEIQLFGMNPHVSHFFNVLFFALTCALLYLLMKRLFKNYNLLIPLSIVLLYLFHPIHTEVVANIKSRDEILGMMFGIASLLLLVKYDDEKQQNHFIWSIILFAAAVFSKENYLMFAIVVPLVLYFFTTTDFKRIVVLSLPYVGVVGLYLLIRHGVLTNDTFKDKLEIINNSLMAAKNEGDRLATEFVMLGKYLYMVFIPYPLSWDYSYNQIPNVSFANIKAILSVLVYLALGAYVIWSLARKEKSVYVFAILFYVITMFLVSNVFVKIGSSFGERFLYAPSLSFCMVLPFGLARAFKLDVESKVWYKKESFYGVLGIILFAYAAILIPRNNAWSNNFTLFLAGVDAAPNSARVHDALASEYRNQAEMSADRVQKSQFYGLSLDEYRKALSIYQDADIYYNMGVSFYEDGMQDSALKVYEKSVALNPNYTLACNNLGVIYFNRHMYDKAITYFMKSYTADTNDVQVITNIGAAYQNQGNAERAVYYYTKVLSKDPANGSVINNLATIYVNSGMQYFDKRDLDNAYNQFTMALKYNPQSASALGNIGVVYQARGNNAKAIEYYQKSLAINPKNEGFMRNLQQITTAVKK